MRPNPDEEIGPSNALVVGIGSAHGDDRAGWEAVRALQARAPCAKMLILRQPLDLVSHLEEGGRLLVIDASAGDDPPGTVRRIQWNAAQDLELAGHSSHGLGISDALRLADSLGKRPRRVIIYAVQVQSCQPGAGLSPAVTSALPELIKRVLGEIGETPHA